MPGKNRSLPCMGGKGWSGGQNLARLFAFTAWASGQRAHGNLLYLPRLLI